MILTPGIHFDVLFADYLADTGINQSELKKFGKAKSPFHYKYKKDHPEEDDDPVHFRIGRYVDNAVFRPKVFERKVYGLKPAEVSIAESCVLSLLHHRDTCRILTACKSQVAVIADEPRRKGLIDLLPDPAVCDPLLLEYAFDLKTAADASDEGFHSACYKFGYHVQAAYYMDLLSAVGRKVTTFVFIVVETKPPFAIAIHYMPSDAYEISEGRKLYTRWLKEYSQCLETNQWPGYSESWTRVRFKPWQLREADEPERMG